MSGGSERSHQPALETVFSARSIAEIMAHTHEQVVLPTVEQAEVIEQPLSPSVLVIAGAGSGKTETMSNRVVWLIANGHATPAQLLGLTFTRKAAGELSERIMRRLHRFVERLSAAEVQIRLNTAQKDRARTLHTLIHEGLELPEVSTYNAFASAIVQEFGAFAGFSSESTVIDESQAWGIARNIVCASNDEALVRSADSINVIVKQILTLDHAISDNLCDFDRVIRSIEQIESLASLPYNEKKQEGSYALITQILEHMQATRLSVRLAREFAEEKRRRGLIEFSDQLALAVQTLRRFPEAIRILRRRTPVVLLDEVQDTSVGQTTLLSMLFAGTPVMAVGDPHQSIYGFRGASASNLQNFHQDFQAQPDATSPTDPAPKREQHQPPQPHRPVSPVTLNLSISWRNPDQVLRAARVVSAPLAAQLEAAGSGIVVRPLRARESQSAQQTTAVAAQVEVRFPETLDEECSALAEWMREALRAHLAETGKTASAAVLFRSGRHMPTVAQALSAAGVPYRIMSVGGLLSTPEVADLVCALWCIWDAEAVNELIRLLTGPRFRIGVSDLHGLRQAAKWFSARDHTMQPLAAQGSNVPAAPLSVPEQTFTLIDALDEIATISDLNHAALRGITELGKTRLREAAQMFRSLRHAAGGDILALLRATTQALRIDLELDAAEHTDHNGSAPARANLDAFFELVETFLSSDEQATLASLLAWLRRAADQDEVALGRAAEAEPGTVQLLTVHGAKGLEWNLVAVPRMVEGEFPSASREGMGELRPGQLPDRLRGDAAYRPKLDLDAVSTQQEAVARITQYQEALRLRHTDEERRLAYVAITRASSRLLLTGSFWGGQRNARIPAIFLRELARDGLISLPTEVSAYDADPSERAPRTQQWPLDPLGQRTQPVHTAASALRKALQQPEHASGQASYGTTQSASLHPLTRLLLAERDAQQRPLLPAASPEPVLAPGERITASTFHEFIEHAETARLRRLRPMPIRPYRRTRTGNLFHEWVERRASTALGTARTLPGVAFDTAPDLPTAAAATDSAATQAELAELIAQFERSRWADRQPIAVELEITLPFAGRTLACKIDAVYRDDTSATPRYEIVDWKSGRPPANEAERQSRFLQLELYRHAYASWAQLDPAQIEVTLFYVAEGLELRGEHRRSYAELEQLWRAATGPAAAPPHSA